ncbi:MAG: alcohol dehydrogenase [Synergistaceae bacterium]|nr:alcohol dehydrogenase [Synergistaceae bacterium]
MLIVGCQVCGESKVLAGDPDGDGVARIHWSCRHCGTGQVLQLEVASDAAGCDLRSLLGGLAAAEEDLEEAGFVPAPEKIGGLFGGLTGQL